MSISRNLAAAAADLDGVLLVVAARLAALDTARVGWPAGRGFDGPASRGSVTFCEVHERERCGCGGGTPMVAVSDPTGEAALVADKAKTDRDRVVAITVSLRRQCDELASILARYAQRPATSREVLETLGDDERSGRCVSCARTHVARGVARWEPAHRGDLCRWCYDWRRRTGQVPPLADLDRHHRGIRDRRPA